jgi:hypothetical protein
MDLVALSKAKVDEPMMHNVRQVFLHVVKSRYWEQIHEGTLPGDSNAAIALLTSVDVALDYSEEKLVDWDKLASSCEVPAYAVALLVWLDNILPEWIEADNWLQDWLVYSRKETAYYIVSCFTDAHRHAQTTIATYFGEGEDVDTPEEYQVIMESKEQIARAQKVIDEMDADMVTSAVSKQVAGIILENERQYISELTESGVITTTEAEELLEHVQVEMSLMHKARRAQARVYMTRYRKDMKEKANEKMKNMKSKLKNNLKRGLAAPGRGARRMSNAIISPMRGAESAAASGSKAVVPSEEDAPTAAPEAASAAASAAGPTEIIRYAA